MDLPPVGSLVSRAGSGCMMPDMRGTRGNAVPTTHDTRRVGETYLKTFRSWERGEHRKEWLVLNLAARWAPGLAPRPLAADPDADPP